MIFIYKRRWPAFFFAGMICVCLTACYFTRLLTVRKQMDDYRSNFVIDASPSNGYFIFFKHPVLYPEDIEQILSEAPAFRSAPNPSTRVSTYIVVWKISRERSDSVPVILQFAKRNNEYKMERVSIPEKFTAIMPRELVYQCLSNASKSSLSVFRKTATLPLDQINTDLLPKPAEIRRIFGDPEESIHGITIVDKYCFRVFGKDERNGRPITVLLTYPKDHPQDIATIRVTYYHYTLDIDINKKLAVIQLLES